MCGSGAGVYTGERILSSIFLTTKSLREKGARCEGLKWFNENFPRGTHIGVAMAACTNPNWIHWVLDAYGRGIDAS